MTKQFVIIAERIPIGFFQNKEEAMNGLKFVKSGFVTEREL